MCEYDRFFKESHYDGGNRGWGNIVTVYECYDGETGEYIGDEEEVTECDENGIPMSRKGDQL